MQIKLLSVVLIRSKHTADTLILKFDLPDGCYPFADKGYATMHVAKDRGVAYCEANFPDVPIEIIPPV